MEKPKAWVHNSAIGGVGFVVWEILEIKIYNEYKRKEANRLVRDYPDIYFPTNDGGFILLMCDLRFTALTLSAAKERFDEMVDVRYVF